MRRPRRGHSYTLMIVPHASDGDVVAFRLPIFWLQLGAVFLVSLWIGILVFMNAYFGMVGHMEELLHLRAVNRQQREQVVWLTEQARQLAGDLRELEALEQQVRTTMGIVASAGEQEPDVRAASTGSGAAAGTLSPLPEDNALVQAAVLTGVGGPDDEAVAADPEGDDTEDPALADLRRVALTLRDVREALPQQREGLEQVSTALAEEQARQDATPSIWPVRGLVTSRYGWRRSPFGVSRQFHHGIDIAAPRGTPIVATADGRVVFSGWDGAFGNAVIIDHGFGYRTLYAHNAYNVVEVGDRVRRGQVVAHVGSTGRSTGPHVHYEVFVKGQRVDPWSFLPGR